MTYPDSLSPNVSRRDSVTVASVTVAICSTGSRPSLVKTIDSILENQDFSGEVEVLVVWSGLREPPYNGSWLPQSVRQIVESNPGSSRAKNTALREARSDFVAMTDDDTVCQRQWLTSLVERWQKGSVLVGGPITLVWPTGRPSWATRRAERMLNLDMGSSSIAVPIGRSLLGANMGMDRQQILELGGFSPRFGPGSDHGLKGADVELTQRAIRAGLAVWYEPEAVVEHHVEPRMGRRRHYLWRMFKLGESVVALDPPLNRVRAGYRVMLRILTSLAVLGFRKEKLDSLGYIFCLIGALVQLSRENDMLVDTLPGLRQMWKFLDFA